MLSTVNLLCFINVSFALHFIHRRAQRAIKLSSPLMGCELSLFRAAHMREWIT